MNYKILINKENPYNKGDFSNCSLVKYKNEFNEEFLIEKKCLQAYLKLKENLALNNINITLDSCYRSLEEQEDLINNYLKSYGEEYTKHYVAEKGYSEHHSALAIDIALIVNNEKVGELNKLEEYLPVFERIIPKLKEYGFILRYPKGKEEITSYYYEPWHYRYVGKSTAKIIMDNNLTLEEYDKLYNRSGILLVNKPKGITSRDVVNKVGILFDTKKVGHNGTLDPLAEGLLVVTINKATKINELLTSEDKEYIASVKVGIETDTLDLEGKVIRESSSKITKEMLSDLFANFPKEYMQEIPLYSAVKIKGRKLYEYARSNKDVDLPKRLVKIKELELLDYSSDSFSFRILVSKGTYIRSIIKDMGEYLNITCTMSNLIRTKQGMFSLKDANNIEDIKKLPKLISIEEALNIKKIDLSKEDYNRVINGAYISNKYNVNDLGLLTYNNKVLAIYKRNGDNLVCYKMLK